MRRAILSLAGLAVANGYQWAQSMGGAYRSGLWPPVVQQTPPVDDVTNLRSAAEEIGSGVTRQHTLRASELEMLSVTKAVSLQYEVQSDFKLAKTPPLVVASTGVVVFSTDDCILGALPNPDLSTTTSWAAGNELWVSTTSLNKTAGSTCYDIVLDEKDNIFQPVMHVNDNPARSVIYGFNPNGFVKGVQPSFFWSAAQAPSGYLDLQGDMRFVAIYSIGLLHTKNHVWVPMDPLDGLTQNGLSIVNTGTAKVTKTTMGSMGFEAVTGGAKIPNTVVGGDDWGVFAIAHEFDAKGPFLRAFTDAGAVRWTTNAQVETDVDQPHPLVDFHSGHIYAIAFEGQSPDAKISIYCFMRATGFSCASPWSDNGIQLQDSFGGFNPGWIFAGSVVLSADRTKTVRLLYSFPLAVAAGNEPTGCIIAIDPATGALVDSYCVPRDTTSPIVDDLFITTGPLVALNARGDGHDVAYVAQFDGTVFAFDPTNLAQGPIAVIRPASFGTSAATVSSDYLSMTSGGALLFPTWDDVSSKYAIVAIPNINQYLPPYSPPSPPSPGPDPGGISPGAGVAVAVAVLSILGATVAWPIYKAGGVDSALNRYLGYKGGVASIPATMASYLPANLQNSLGKYGKIGGGGSGATQSLYTSSSYGASSPISVGSPSRTAGGAYSGGAYNSPGYGSTAL